MCAVQAELERDTETLKKEVVDIRLLAQRDIVLDPQADMLEVSPLPQNQSAEDTSREWPQEGLLWSPAVLACMHLHGLSVCLCICTCELWHSRHSGSLACCCHALKGAWSEPCWQMGRSNACSQRALTWHA